MCCGSRVLGDCLKLAATFLERLTSSEIVLTRMEFLGVRSYVWEDLRMITDRGCGEEMAEKISKKILKTESLSISFTDSQMSGVRLRATARANDSPWAATLRTL